MNRAYWQPTWARLLGQAASLLGISLASAGAAWAQPYAWGQRYNAPMRPITQYAPEYGYGAGMDYQPSSAYSSQPAWCPPGYQPQYQLPAPQQPMGQPTPIPGLPPTGQPPAGQPSASGAQPQAPAATGQTTQPESATQPQTADAQQPMSDFQASQASSSRASLSPGADTPQLGRNDQSNRLNLFDNMAAAPQSRIWFGFQFAEQFDTALRPTQGLQSFLDANPSLPLDTVLALNEGITSNYFQYDQAVYRVGGEYAVTDYFSVAVQGQYVASHGDGGPSDTWTNPQILLKQLLYRDCDTVLSATLGVTPEISNERGDINEPTTKIYPGLLFYEEITHNWFTQGGVQWGIPVDDNEITHPDWSIALSYWLYRDSAYQCGGRCHRPFFLRDLHVTGIIPQINVLGKHVSGTNTIVGPFGFQPFATQVITGFETNQYLLCDPVTGDPIPGPPITVTTPVTVPFVLPEGFVIYQEPRSVIDLTIGTTILMGDGIQIGVGWSFPLTDDSVRDNEFISTISYVF